MNPGSMNLAWGKKTWYLNPEKRSCKLWSLKVFKSEIRRCMIYFVDESHLTTLQVQAKSIKRSSIHAKSEIDPERAYFDILCIFQVGTRCPSSVSLRFFLFSAFLALSQRSQMQSLQVLLFWVGADTASHKLLCFPCFCTEIVSRFLGFLMQLGPSEWTFLHEISWASYIFSDFFQKICCWHTAKWCRTCPKSWRIRMTEARKKMRGNWDAIQLVIFIDIQIIHNYSFERTTVSPIFRMALLWLWASLRRWQWWRRRRGWRSAEGERFLWKFWNLHISVDKKFWKITPMEIWRQRSAFEFAKRFRTEYTCDGKTSRVQSLQNVPTGPYG